MPRIVYSIVCLFFSSYLSTTEVWAKCIYSRVHGMQGVDCAGHEFTEIPANLKTTIEILDASYNRIRHIDSIAQYSDLKFLYLGENMIMDIDEGTVDQLHKLEVLDLSVNSLQSIPPFLFDNTHLRKLYLANNSFRFDLLEGVNMPIKAPLEYIDISHSMVRQMPKFGMLPDLNFLNISGNFIDRISLEDVIGLCRLEIFDITGLKRNRIDTCECVKLQNFLTSKSVRVIPNVIHICNYTTELSRCTETDLSPDEQEIFNDCINHVRIREQRAQVKSYWTIAVYASIGSLTLIVIVLLFFHFRNKKAAKSVEKKTFKGLTDQLIVS